MPGVVVVMPAEAAPVIDTQCGGQSWSSCPSAGCLVWSVVVILPQCWLPRVVVSKLPQCWLPRVVVVVPAIAAPVLAASCDRGHACNSCPIVGCLVWSVVVKLPQCWTPRVVVVKLPQCWTPRVVVGIPAAAPVLDASCGRGHACNCCPIVGCLVWSWSCLQ